MADPSPAESGTVRNLLQAPAENTSASRKPTSLFNLSYPGDNERGPFNFLELQRETRGPEMLHTL
jgi:hypothetical protein